MTKDRENRPAVAIALAVAMLLLVGVFAVSVTSDDHHKPRPFDPLSVDEQAQAVDATLQDPNVQAILSDDHEVIGAALNTDKNRLRADPDSRHADIWIYDYQADQTIYAQIDMRAKKVHEFLLKDFQPPMTAGERDRAAQLALDEPEVQKELAELEYEELDWTARLWTGEADGACPVHRCILVAFILDGDYLPDPMVRVNLSLGVVDGFLDEVPHHEHKVGGAL